MELIDLAAYRGFTLPLVYTPSGGIGQGKLWTVGPGCDLDLGHCLSDVEVQNTGTYDLIVANTLRGAVQDTAYTRTAKAGKSAFLPGDSDTIAILNPNANAGTATCDLTAKRQPKGDSAREGGHPGHGEYLVRLTGTPNATKTVSRTIREPITVTGIYAWSKTIPASAAGTYLGSCSGGGNNLLSTATINLETAITTVTLYTATLTATTANLDLYPGDVLSFSAVSNNADLAAGDLCFAVAYTLR